MVGEAPGKFENFQAKPFVGPAGKLLEDYMSVAGLDETNTYITNVVKFRPIDGEGNNRTPTKEEIFISTGYLQEEWAILSFPRTIVTIGVIPTRVFIPNVKSIFKVAGTKHIIADQVVNPDCVIIPMVHPAYILRNPHQKATFEEHWKWLGGAIE